MTQPESVTDGTVTAASGGTEAPAESAPVEQAPAETPAAPPARFVAKVITVPAGVTDIRPCPACGQLFTSQALVSHQAPKADGLGGWQGFTCLPPADLDLVQVESADGTAWASPADVAGWEES